jgi:hypothetical protein
MTDPYADIRARLAAVPPAPWTVTTAIHGSDAGDYTVYGVSPIAECDYVVTEMGEHPTPDLDPEVAELIAHAPTDIARLLRDLDRVRDLVDTWTRRQPGVTEDARHFREILGAQLAAALDGTTP